MLPTKFIDAVVAIGDAQDGGTRWIASGFFYGKHIVDRPDGSADFRIFLVTNRHVSDSARNPKIRINPQGAAPAEEFDLTLHTPEGLSHWVSHPDPRVDVSVMGIDLNIVANHQVYFFGDTMHSATLSEMESQGLVEGASTYILGFPMANVGDWRNTVVVRGGTIARFRDTLEGYSKSFLVDGFVFPGNSGGPAVSRPEAFAVQGSPVPRRAVLLGVVASYVPYEDVALSAQTGQPRVVFSENTGLTNVFPVDCIRETIEAYESIHPSPPVESRSGDDLAEGAEGAS